MKYNSLNISWFEIFIYLVKLFITKTFGSKTERKINPETGDDDPNGFPIESSRDIALMTWAYIFHGMNSDKGGFDRTFLLDQIWYEKASPELQKERAEFEAADQYMLNNM
jgi:hypothetical protein